MSENLNSKDILKLLDELNTSLTKECYVPSIGVDKGVKLKPLTTTHMKQIIKSTIDGAFASIQFNLIFHPILQEILEANAGDINVYDKIAIVLQLRALNVSPILPMELKAVTKNPDKEFPPTIKYDLNIAEHIEFIKLNSQDVFKPDTVANEGYTAGVYFPSLNEEYLFDVYLNKNFISKIKEDDTKAIRELFGPMFMNNVAQYVKSVKIKDNVVNLVKMPVAERLAIVNNLPGTKDIFLSIDNKFGKTLQKITKISIVQDEIEYSGDISIGPELFVSN